MREVTFHAVVVGSADLGEADRIVRLLTPELGRLSVVARRARSSKRRFGGVLDVGTRIVAHVSQGKGMPVLQSADRRGGPEVARTSFERIAQLGYGCELCAGLSPEETAAHKLFRLLEAWLELLEQADAPGVAARLALEAKALTFAGLTPALARCASCGEPLDDPTVFDPAAGGGLHGRCGGGALVPASILVEIEALRRTPMADAVGHPFDRDYRWLLSDFAQYQLGRRLMSRSMLEV